MRPSEDRLQALRDYYVDDVDGAGDVEDLFAEIDALTRERDTLLAAMQAEPPDDEVVRYFQRLHGLPEIGLVGVERELQLRAEKADRALAGMREALTYIEWVWDGRENTCPSCGISEHAGHDSSCRTDAALRPFEEASDES